jgi:DNA (cytosine-5)-methyltransferase 1
LCVDTIVPDVAVTLTARMGKGFNSGVDEGQTPVVVVPIDLRQTARGENNTNNRHNSSGGSPGTGIANDGDPAFTVSARGQAVVLAFSCKDYGGDATIGVAPTLRAMSHDGSHANGGGQVAVAFHATMGGNDGGVYQDGSTPTITTGRRPAITSHSSLGSRNGDVVEDVCTVVQSSAPPAIALAFQPRIARNGRGQLEQIAPALNGASSGTTSDSRPCVVTDMAVRRLTPRECERLQGFPDDYTQIPYRGKPAADGPRYKALGNSMAVNVMRWIGERLRRFP